MKIVTVNMIYVLQLLTKKKKKNLILVAINTVYFILGGSTHNKEIVDSFQFEHCFLLYIFLLLLY